MRIYIVILLVYFCDNAKVNAQTFQTFLSQLKSISYTDIDNVLKKESEMNNLSWDTIEYKSYFPIIDKKSYCDVYSQPFWSKGAYIKTKDDKILAFLLLNYPNYPDGNNQYFMENEVDELWLVVYNLKGKVLDQQLLGRVGISNELYHLRLHYVKPKKGIQVQEEVLTNPQNIFEYKDLVYSRTQKDIEINPKGSIVMFSSFPTYKVVKAKPFRPLSFSSFLSYFEKYDGKRIDVHLFDSSKKAYQLPIPNVYSLLPDSICQKASLASILWEAGKYIVYPKYYVCFLKSSSLTPKVGYPYMDYLLLYFSKHKKHPLLKVKCVYTWSDTTSVTQEHINDTITNKLRTILRE